ncbi:hypothetical protein GCM10023192_62820 [Amycolatopsis samaneae]
MRRSPCPVTASAGLAWWPTSPAPERFFELPSAQQVGSTVAPPPLLRQVRVPGGGVEQGVEAFGDRGVGAVGGKSGVEVTGGVAEVVALEVAEGGAGIGRGPKTPERLSFPRFLCSRTAIQHRTPKPDLTPIPRSTR